MNKQSLIESIITNMFLFFFSLINNYFNFYFIHPYIFLIFFFHLIFFILFFLINKTNKDKSKNIRNLLISIILRFTFSLFFLILIGILEIESYNIFIMNFFAFYLLYIIFEITILLINLQPT